MEKTKGNTSCGVPHGMRQASVGEEGSVDEKEAKENKNETKEDYCWSW